MKRKSTLSLEGTKNSITNSHALQEITPKYFVILWSFCPEIINYSEIWIALKSSSLFPFPTSHEAITMMNLMSAPSVFYPVFMHVFLKYMNSKCILSSRDITSNNAIFIMWSRHNVWMVFISSLKFKAFFPLAFSAFICLWV